MTRFSPMRLVVGVLMLFSVTMLAACDNTIRGIGRDAEETGDAISDAVT